MRNIIAGIVIVAVVAIGAWLAVGRPSVEATAGADPDVTVQCSGATSVSAEQCQVWGDEILGLGAPSTTFEMQDIARLAIDRPLFGFGSPCEVSYFLQRYPDEAVWNSDVPCR